ncbi:MAG: hypothetical protein Tsb009_23530 [Planctomycetaceae bacterium]
MNSTNITETNSSSSTNITHPLEENGDDDSQQIRKNESRNLFVLAFHHTVLRVAWIFKTESVIMPAFVDAISGAGWLRGCLPLLNRFGQSVPSLMLADRLRRTRRKKWALLATSWAMAIPFLTISLLWWLLEDKRQPWLPPVFLVFYFLFFTFTGLNQLSFGTVQGKLISPWRRGRLMGRAGIFGAIFAILCAWFFLRSWLKRSDGGYGLIFGFTGMGFLLAGLISLWIREPADEHASGESHPQNPFREAWKSLKSDINFRRLCIVGMLFMTAQMLFPHYQAMGREQGGYTSVSLMVWVIAQNAGAGVFSPIVGMIADRFGNRITLQLEILGAALTPLLALLLVGHVFDGWTGPYWLTFFLLSFVPVTVKTLVNYTLELCPPEKHASYLSTVKVCMAIPFLLSPLVGLMIDRIGFQPVFLAVCVVILAAGAMTFLIPEPRWDVKL